MVFGETKHFETNLTEFKRLLLKEKSHWHRILNKTKVINRSNNLAFLNKKLCYV